MDKSNESKSIKPNYWEIATRQMTIVDKDQQNKFKNAKIAVIGCGGIGGGAIEILARMGVGELNIIDEDDFDVSNLNRQLMSSIETLGENKAKVSKEQVKLINPHTKVNAFNEKLTEENLKIVLKDCDVIIDGLDNIYTRIIVSRYAMENNIPFIHGAIHGTLGQLSVFSKDTKSYEELFALPSFNKELNNETKELIENLSSTTPPSIGPTPNIIGFLQGFEAFKVITDLGKVTYAPKILKFDLLDLKSFDIIEL
ncbi:MAG: HesA/MoeB/ThiF family protein [Methanobacteriaceae archaeon]|nr:HesA/MoeB/ThiF family protein [Methanobacteriaceae archaeon]